MKKFLSFILFFTSIVCLTFTTTCIAQEEKVSLANFLFDNVKGITLTQTDKEEMSKEIAKQFKIENGKLVAFDPKETDNATNENATKEVSIVNLGAQKQILVKITNTWWAGNNGTSVYLFGKNKNNESVLTLDGSSGIADLKILKSKTAGFNDIKIALFYGCPSVYSYVSNKNEYRRKKFIKENGCEGDPRGSL
jgi:hypothetical protein